MDEKRMSDERFTEHELHHTGCSEKDCGMVELLTEARRARKAEEELRSQEAVTHLVARLTAQYAEIEALRPDAEAYQALLATETTDVGERLAEALREGFIDTDGTGIRIYFPARGRALSEGGGQRLQTRAEFEARKPPRDVEIVEGALAVRRAVLAEMMTEEARQQGLDAFCDDTRKPNIERMGDAILAAAKEPVGETNDQSPPRSPAAAYWRQECMSVRAKLAEQERRAETETRQLWKAVDAAREFDRRVTYTPDPKIASAQDDLRAALAALPPKPATIADLARAFPEELAGSQVVDVEAASPRPPKPAPVSPGVAPEEVKADEAGNVIDFATEKRSRFDALAEERLGGLIALIDGSISRVHPDDRHMVSGWREQLKSMLPSQNIPTPGPLERHQSEALRLADERLPGGAKALVDAAVENVARDRAGVAPADDDPCPEQDVIEEWATGDSGSDHEIKRLRGMAAWYYRQNEQRKLEIRAQGDVIAMLEDAVAALESRISNDVARAPSELAARVGKLEGGR